MNPLTSIAKRLRPLCAWLLGEGNSANLYKENRCAEEFEAEAKRIGATVVALEEPAANYLGCFRVVDPLTYPKQKKGAEKQQEIALRDGLRFDRDGSDHATTANDGKGVPPELNLQPGERITHVMVMPPCAKCRCN